MADTVTVRGTGGAVWEMDVPAEGTQARARYDQQVANGDLVEVDSTPAPAPRKTSKSD